MENEQDIQQSGDGSATISPPAAVVGAAVKVDEDEKDVPTDAEIAQNSYTFRVRPVRRAFLDLKAAVVCGGCQQDMADRGRDFKTGAAAVSCSNPACSEAGIVFTYGIPQVELIQEDNGSEEDGEGTGAAEAKA